MNISYERLKVSKEKFTANVRYREIYLLRREISVHLDYSL